MCIYVITVNSSIENRCGLYEKCFTQFMKKVSSQIFFFPKFPENFFLPGEISGKISPGDFRGTPGKISGNPGKSRKIPENPGVFLGFPGWKRALPPQNSGTFSPKKGSPGKNSREFPENCPPGNSGNFRKFPEIFPRISRGGPRGGPSDVSG